MAHKTLTRVERERDLVLRGSIKLKFMPAPTSAARWTSGAIATAPPPTTAPVPMPSA